MKIGDFVTGKDQSYVRSIYEVVGFTKIDGEDAVKLVFRSFMNEIADYPDKIYIRPKNDFMVVSQSYIKTIPSLSKTFCNPQMLSNLPEGVSHKISTWLLTPEQGKLKMTPVLKSEFDPDGE